jgi:hypothetical protein
MRKEQKNELEAKKTNFWIFREKMDSKRSEKR